MYGNLAYSIIHDLYLRNRNFCSTDYDFCLSYIHDLIPLKIHTFEENQPYNGWEIPPKWDLVKGEIWRDSQLIFKATHPLHVIGLSRSFSGNVSLEELKKHLHYDARFPNSVPYHFRQNYRPWERDWGFCVTKDFYDSLSEGNYEVTIQTAESKGYLKVAEHTHQGENPETFVFVAHLDHPGMANDDLAGVAVGVEAFHHLLQKKTKFTYRLVILQEIIGSAFYLGKIPKALDNVLEACFLEMLGSDTPLALQRSSQGKGHLETTLANLLENSPGFRQGPFRGIVCNDEMVWESYGIPMASLSRFPYPEYHSDKDNIDIMNKKSLHESVEALIKTIETIDQSILMRKKFSGVLAVSNPCYNLYVDPGQMAFGVHVNEDQKKLRLLMDILPILPKNYFVDQIIDELQMPKEIALDYLNKWKAKQLIDLI